MSGDADIVARLPCNCGAPKRHLASRINASNGDEHVKVMCDCGRSGPWALGATRAVAAWQREVVGVSDLRAANAALLTERDALAERLREATVLRPPETAPEHDVLFKLHYEGWRIGHRGQGRVNAYWYSADAFSRMDGDVAGWLPLPSPEGTADA
jgi:hypothetical protein